LVAVAFARSGVERAVESLQGGRIGARVGLLRAEMENKVSVVVLIEYIEAGVEVEVVQGSIVVRSHS